MSIKIKKWTYKPFKRIIMPYKKVIKYQIKNKCFIYDTRNISEFNVGHIEGSENVSVLWIKRKLKEHKKWDRIILVGKHERTNAALTNWARTSLNFHRIYLLEGGIINLDPSQLKKKKSKKNK